MWFLSYIIGEKCRFLIKNRDKSVNSHSNNWRKVHIMSDIVGEK